MPGDLNLKKSWNPALIKNQKKVWEREQEALKELQSIKQRQKEIVQEREKEEMLRLQYGSDPSSMPTKDKLALNKLGWMYNDGPKDAQNSPKNESGFREVDEDFLAKSDKIAQLLRRDGAVKTSVARRFDKVASVGTQAPAGILNDDPLLMIKREHFRKRSDRRDRSPERLYAGRNLSFRYRESHYSHKNSHKDNYRDNYRDSHRDDYWDNYRDNYRDSHRDSHGDSHRESNKDSHRDSYRRRERYDDRDRLGSSRSNRTDRNTGQHTRERPSDRPSHSDGSNSR